VDAVRRVTHRILAGAIEVDRAELIEADVITLDQVARGPGGEADAAADVARDDVAGRVEAVGPGDGAADEVARHTREGDPARRPRTFDRVRGVGDGLHAVVIEADVVVLDEVARGPGGEADAAADVARDDVAGRVHAGGPVLRRPADDVARHTDQGHSAAPVG